MRDGLPQSGQAARGSGQNVKTVDNGLLLLTNRVHCSQLGFTHSDDNDLLSTRARCVDIYTFPNDLSEEEESDRFTNGYVSNAVKGNSRATAVHVSDRGGGGCKVGGKTDFFTGYGGKMSTVEHQVTVDKGLKMKIKRKGVGAKSADSKHEIVKGDVTKCTGNVDVKNANPPASGPSSNPSANLGVDKAVKHGVQADKEKSPKLKNTHKKEKAKDKVKSCDLPTTMSSGLSLNGIMNPCATGNMFNNGLEVAGGCSSTLPTTPEPKTGEVPCSAKPSLDPYEFNAKVEDGIGVPMKKIKVEKVETASSPVHPSSCQDASTEMCSVGVSTDPECLGPCEPGTSVTLEGIVWTETESGVLVINVTWRGKTYVGTLLDATRHDWAPPRLTSESPVSDMEVRTPKGRGKRGRGVATPVIDRTVGAANESRKLRKGRRTSNANGFQAPPSPAKSDVSLGAKRKGRPPELDLTCITEGVKPPKRSRSSSRGTPSVESPSSILIECPEPNCNKKYKHINGLRYHQTHAHQNNNPTAEANLKDLKTEDTESVKSSDNIDSQKDNKTCSNTKGNSESGSKKGEKCSNKSEETEEDNTVTTRQSKSSETSSQKAETVSKKKDISVTVTTTATPTSNTVSKLTVSPQVYQLGAGPIGCLGGVTSVSPASNSSATPSTASSTNSTTISTSPSATVTSESSKSETVKDNEKHTKSEKGDKSKSKSARPIMPAPSPQMMALSSNVPVVSHSSLSPVSMHTQMSPSLKAIQPKPTIMGEPSNVNPSLIGLKDKKPKSKKKSSKDKDGVKSNPKEGAKEDSLKCERSGVIKSSPPKTSDSTKKDASLGETSKLISEAQRSVSSSSMNSQLSPNIMDSSHGPRLAPSANRDLAKAGSPLQVKTPEGKSPVNDDVQSPAYSDISDANDSASPVSNEEISDKAKPDEPESKKEDKGAQQRSQGSSENPNMSQYGMYSYYGQSQYPHNVMSNVQQPQNLSQNNQKSTVSSRDEVDLKTRIVEVKKESEASLSESTEDNKPKSHQPEMAPSPRQQMTPQQIQEYQVQQQKWMQQMYALQNLPPQYHQYLQAYGYQPTVDQAYHMHHMNTDPHYRQHNEKMMEEQKRAHEERFKAEEREHGKDSVKRNADVRDLSTPSKYGQQSTANSKASDRPTDLRRPSATLVHSNESAAREQNLRDKRMENHQIIKENIELKPQMDREKSKQECEAALRMQDRNEDDLRRYQMYQQKMSLQQRAADGRKSDTSSKQQVEPSTAKPNSEKLSGENKSHSASSDFHDSHKKDSSETKVRDNGSGKLTSESNKSVEDKVRGDKARTDDPRSRMGFPPSARGSPAISANTPTSNAQSQAQYASYISYPSYMQSAYGHQIPFDPNHQMYRGINPVLGYANPTYLHPSQLGYRSGQGEVDEKAKVNLVAAGSPSPKVVPQVPADSDPKAVELLQHHASQYYQGHKIHELQEKGRSSSRSSPMQKGAEPAVAGPVANFDKHREASTKSPPTQRHVHTHHHTHVVGGFPMYGPYGAPIIGQQSSTPTSPSAGSPPSLSTPTPGVPHSFPSK